jgi:hypothetical protein
MASWRIDAVDIGQPSSNKLLLGRRIPPPQPAQSARRPFIHSPIVNIIVGCADHSYVPYPPSCHGARRHAPSCSSSIHPPAKSKKFLRATLLITELRGRAPHPMGTARPKTKRGRRRRSGSRPSGYAGTVGVFSRRGSTLWRGAQSHRLNACIR